MLFRSALTNRHCLDCGITHLVDDCPLKLEKKENATSSMLETKPSTSGNESEKAKPVNVVRRAQALKDAAQQTEDEGKSEKSSPSSWKARRQKRVVAKRKPEERAKHEHEQQALD